MGFVVLVARKISCLLCFGIFEVKGVYHVFIQYRPIVGVIVFFQCNEANDIMANLRSCSTCFFRCCQLIKCVSTAFERASESRMMTCPSDRGAKGSKHRQLTSEKT